MAESLREISEQQVSGDLAALYLDIKRALRVPLVNLLYRVWAAEGVLPLLWEVAHPNLQTIDFENKADSLRTEAVEKIAYDVEVPAQSSRMNALNLSAADIETIRLELGVFHYINPKLLLHCALLKRAIGRWGYRGTGQSLGQIEPGVPSEMPKEIVMVDPKSAVPEMQQLFDEIRNQFKLRAINSDYRALAKWPNYLRLAWMDLRQYHESSYYALHEKNLRHYAAGLVNGLPYSARITAEDAKRAGIERAKLVELVDPFFELLPGLILNIAFLKIAIDGADEARRSPFPVQLVARA
jgi:halocarboxylic acid dehydrogenase DehI